MAKKKKKILFLDDQESRHNLFKNNTGSRIEIISVYTARQAIEKLDKEGPFDTVYLDHDLDGVYMPSDEGSGYRVAEHISYMDKEKRPSKVVVHSWNEEGAIKMVKLLKEAGQRVAYTPFQTHLSGEIPG